MVIQAMKMAPECTVEQAVSNLQNDASRVFEGILSSEDRNILPEVQQIRQQRMFPNCRTRYRIGGERYRQVMLWIFQRTHPSIYRHLQKRSWFCDYLLQTGVFNDADLDAQHQELYL